MLSPAGLLARGLGALPAFPRHPPQWLLEKATAYSCGGSRGFGRKALTAFPLGPFGTVDGTDYK